MKWKKDEIEFLKHNFNKYSDTKLSEILKKTRGSIVSKRNNLGLKKDKSDKKEITCLNCNESYSVYKNRESKFCSRKCQGEYSKKTSGSIRKCIVCGEDFYAKGNPKNRKICSRKCRDELKKSGKLIKCDYCGEEIYKPLGSIKRSKHLFCGNECANKFQKCVKIKFTCELCNNEFEKYPSEIKNAELLGKKIRFCSTECRDNDPRRFERMIKMNLEQNKNKEPTKLEKRGRELLLNITSEFIEQHLINNKICVDVYIPESNLIIEWWGDYWHGYNTINPEKRQKRRMDLDISQRKYLEKCGYKVLTFWEHEVYNEPETVRMEIMNYL